jgi:CDGSH-type Zn-finger protein
MAFRLPTFVCANGHRYEQLVQSDVTTSTCRCGAPAESKPYRPGDRMNVRSCERVSRDEVKQYLAQFGERDENGKWKFIPKNRDELNVALKMEGVVAISDREFNDLVDKRDSQREQERAEAPSPLAGETGVEFAKARREWFRSAHDNGYRTGQHDDTEFWQQQGVEPPIPAEPVSAAEIKQVAEAPAVGE